MTIPLIGYWRRLGLSPRFYVVLVLALALIVGSVYVGLSVGNPEMAALMWSLVVDLTPPVLALLVFGALVIGAVRALFS